MCEPKEIPMTDKITSFKLNWYDCGLCCADDAVQEELAIYRNNNYMVFKELNGYGVIRSCEIIHINQDRVKEFFDFLEKTSDKSEFTICAVSFATHRAAVCCMHSVASDRLRHIVRTAILIIHDIRT